MPAYLDFGEFKSLTVMPSDDVDYLEAKYPGFIASRLLIASSRLNARLTKQYAVPFAAKPNTPEIVRGWICSIVTVEAYDKRGWNPADEQSSRIVAAKELAETEIKEAADSEVGLFELPLREDLTGTSAKTKGGPYAYSEPDPYSWTDRQEEAARGR